MRVNVYYVNGAVERGRTIPSYTKLKETVVVNLKNGNSIFIDQFYNTYSIQEFIPKSNLTPEGESLAKNQGFMIKE